MAGTFLTLARVLIERHAQERSCRWSAARLQDFQERCTRQLRRHALANSPFYQEFHRGLDGRPLHQLPIMTKSLLMERFDDIVTDRRLRLADLEIFLREDGESDLYLNRYVVLSTSGSTGRRGVFVFDEGEWIRAMAAITRPIAWARRRGDSRRLPRAALIASGARWHYSARVGRSLANRIAPALRLDASMPVEELVRALNEWQPQALATYPSVLRRLAAEQSSGHLRIPLKHIATSAEVLTGEIRAAVRQAWSIPVQDTYGATELAPIASECAEGRKHLFENAAQIEITDARGKAVPPGELGERVLITVFGRYVQPLIRYEISDLVRLSAQRCPCGRPYRVIESVDGREEDVLNFPSAQPGEPAVAVHPLQFHQALENLPVDAWQVAQTSCGLEIRLVGRDDEGTCAAARRAVTAALANAGASVPAISVRTVPSLVRGASAKAPLILREMQAS